MAQTVEAGFSYVYFGRPGVLFIFGRNNFRLGARALRRARVACSSSLNFIASGASLSLAPSSGFVGVTLLSFAVSSMVVLSFVLLSAFLGVVLCPFIGGGGCFGPDED